MDEQDWLHKSQEMLGDIKQWRRAHPKTTFVEMEYEIHTRMMQLEAQMLQETAQDSRSREWAGAPAQDHPHCPKCHVPLKARGKHQRTHKDPLEGEWEQIFALLYCWAHFSKSGMASPASLLSRA